MMPPDAVVVPDAPPLPGLWFRPIRGEADAVALRNVHVGRLERDGVDPLSTLERLPGEEEVRSALAKAVVDGQADRWLVALVEDAVVGYGRIAWWRESDGRWVYLTQGWVLPGWRGHGIGTAMLRWGEERCRRLAATDHPGEPCELAGNASATETEAAALLAENGYRVGYVVLEMGLDGSAGVPEAPLPDGFHLRPVGPADLRAIAESVEEAYRDEYPGGRYQDDFDPGTYAAEIGAPTLDRSLWQVAWDGDRVAGQVLTAIEAGRGEVFEVSVRPAWRRRGLGRALLSRAVRGLRARDVQVIRLHTRADFPTRARDLYASLGCHILKEFYRYRKPFGG